MKTYQSSDRLSSLWQLTNSVVPYMCVYALSIITMRYSVWTSLLLSIVASGFFIRIFIIFHDCGHYSFFKHPRTNRWVGHFTGVLTFFPYYKWRYEHAVHHATSGNLNHRGVGDIWILTVQEYASLPKWRQLVYRLYRNPLVLFGLGPFYMFARSRFNRKGASQKERWNTYSTNFILLALMTLLGALFGWKSVLITQGTILYCAGMVGVWLFYVQHQFDPSYFEEQANWDYFQAALHGSSFYSLPSILQWFTGNIGYHHVHHVGPGIPNYKLQQAHEQIRAFQDIPEITLRRSLTALRYRLWDEVQKCFVSFRDIRRR